MFPPNLPGNFSNSEIAIAILQDDRSSLIQAMSFVALEVINQNFIGNFSDYDVSLASTRF